MDVCVCVCVEGDGVMNYEWMESRNDRYQVIKEKLSSHQLRPNTCRAFEAFDW